MKAYIFFIIFVKLCSSSDTKEGRIVNGIPAVLGQLPYQAGLQLTKVTKLKAVFVTWCGGSLINSQWILTAGHCTNNSTQGVAYLGTILRANSPYNYSFPGSNIFTHSGFAPGTFRDDVGLIKLPTPTTYTVNIKPIKLASSNLTTYMLQTVTASGWGRASQNGTGSQTLNYVQLSVMPLLLCKLTNPRVTDIHICTWAGPLGGTCLGDSGGPLTIPKNNEPVQIALTSYVPANDCANGNPDIFTRISQYIPWIRNHTLDIQTVS